MQPGPGAGGVDGANPSDKKYAMNRIQNNEKIIYWSRTYISIFSGCVTGVMGYTGPMGIVCYLVAQTILSFGLMASMGFNSSKYYHKANHVWTSQLTGGALSFILFWTLMYDICHQFG